MKINNTFHISKDNPLDPIILSKYPSIILPDDTNPAYSPADIMDDPTCISDIVDMNSLINSFLYFEKMYCRLLESPDDPRYKVYLSLMNNIDARLCHLSLMWELSRLHIKGKSGRFVRFRMNPSQRIIMDVYNKMQVAEIPIRIILLKPRQFGGSTLFQALLYVLTKRNEGTSALAVAHKNTIAKHFMKMQSTFLNWDENKRDKGFVSGTGLAYNDKKGGGIEIASGFTDTDGRGTTNQYLHLSEVAYYRTTDALVSLMESVPYKKNTLAVVESTPNGLNIFYDIWKGRDDGYERVFSPWYAHDEYRLMFRNKEEEVKFIDTMTADEKELYLGHKGVTYHHLNFRRRKINGPSCQGSADVFDQEYPRDPESCFLGSGRSFFTLGIDKNLERIEQHKHNYRNYRVTEEAKYEKLPFVFDEHGDLTIFHHPQPGISYAMGVDVAEGLEVTGAIGLSDTDYSVIQVISRTNPIRQMCEYRSRTVPPDKLASVIDIIGRYYNNCTAAIERNNHGHTTISWTKEYYPYLFRMPTDLLGEKALKILSASGNAETRSLGWLTTGGKNSTRIIMLDDMNSKVRHAEIEIYSEHLIREMTDFIINSGGRAEARGGKHDDCVISMAIALQCLIRSPGSIPKNIHDKHLDKVADMGRLIEDINEAKPGESFPGYTVLG